MLLLYSFGLAGARKTPTPAQAGGNLLRRARVCCTPSTYGAPAYTAGSNSAPWSRRNVDSATCKTFQSNVVACSTFLNRLTAVVVWGLGRATSLAIGMKLRS